MRVEYICHACLLIDTGDVRLVTDPWFKGPAYSEQWYVFPQPVDTHMVASVDAIIISHAHEDHFHPRTLRHLPKSARVFYPYSWFGGTKEFLESLGFEHVSEAVNFRKYRLTKKTSVTYLAQGHDNIVVIESDGKVLVNANDALHSESDETIDFYLEVLRHEWPQIDMLFCGFGGASYFPNMLHVDGKDDYEVGVVREQLFAHNFCRIVAGLRPRVAVPFAADFALLAPAARWINDVRFPRRKMKSYYQEYFARDACEQKIYDMYPGDVLEDSSLQPASPYRQRMKNGELNHLIDEQYAEEIERKKTPRFLAEGEAAQLGEKVREFISSRAGLFDAATLRTLKFCLRVSDVGDDNCYNVSFKENQAQLRRTAKPDEACVLVVEVPSGILRYSIKYEWGGDALSIGYGADMHLRDREVAAANLDQVCFGLLTRHPTRKGYIKENPRRVFNYIIRQPPIRAWKSWAKSRLGNVNYDRSIWLLRNAEEIRKILGLPKVGEAGLVASDKIRKNH
ncbi:MAG TPA: MBL fold metallo-hydrolase [Pyrinomonadaceae bacterium]|nr:MBL fold metallo-hydrolase [Pyrinomonadaceae bacterium]